MSHIKGALNQITNPTIYLKECPSIFNRDNINNKCVVMSLVNGLMEITILELLTWLSDISQDAVKEAIELGANIIDFNVQYTNPAYYKILLEAGLDPNKTVFEHKHVNLLDYATYYKQAKFEHQRLIVDYGGKIPFDWQFNRRNDNVYPIDQYASLSNTRVSICRKSLCALLWCSRRGFIPLRGIILELTRVAWAQRGGEGCGPRGKEWKRE